MPEQLEITDQSIPESPNHRVILQDLDCQTNEPFSKVFPPPSKPYEAFNEV